MKESVIIFDLDGTLIDSMCLWREVDIEFLNKRCIAMPSDLFVNLKSNSIKDTAVYFKERFSLKETIDEIIDEWIEATMYYYKNTIKLKSDALILLDYLREKKNKILAIGTSNMYSLTEAVLKLNGILHYFTTIVTGCTIIQGKPEPDIYLQVAWNLKVNPSDCLVFEDSLVGVQAAKNAGMRVYAIEDESALEQKQDIIKIADKYFTNFAEVISQLK